VQNRKKVANTMSEPEWKSEKQNKCSCFICEVMC